MGLLKGVDCTKLQRSTALEAETDYNVIRVGVSYSGFCNTSGCRAFRKSIVCNRGLGDHIVNDDMAMGIVTCPVCRARVELRAINIFDSNASISVQHDEGETVQFVTAKGDEIISITMQKDQTSTRSPLLVISATAIKRCTVQ